MSFEQETEEVIQNYNSKKDVYFKETDRVIIQNNFKILDKDQDGLLSWEEAQDLMLSLDY